MSDAKRSDERHETIATFKQAVNMTAKALERWLASASSRAVGMTHEDEHESVGHRSGRRIVELLQTQQAELTEADLSHMRKVVGYVKRHGAQRPEGEVSETPWRHSSMNWGHDPLKGR